MTTQDNKYRKLHHWLVNNYGYANKCESVDCNHNNPKRFEWALIYGKNYEYNRENFIMLCPSCHRKYDALHLNEEQIKKRYGWRKGRKPPNIRSISQFTKDGIFIKDFNELTQASKEIGILRTSISNNLIGYSKTADIIYFNPDNCWIEI